MIFKSVLGKVLGGLSNFSPVKNLIKYILDKSLNELLSDQISLQDFKNGQLSLSNINLNLEKINREYLLSSPYILHRGDLRRLRITLPSWSQLSTKSIEIVAEGLQVDLKPNKQFADNFKQAMRDVHADISQPPQPGGIDNPMDFFRQLVKQIILNMKIKVENIAIRLFINEPTREQTAKPQYYLMFRLPLLTIGRSEDVVSRGQDIQELKFDMLVPQMSLHLLKQGLDFPEYFNEKVSKQDFPFSYPPVNHPSTIIIIGQASSLTTVNCEKCTKLTITHTTFFKKQKKVTAIQGRISNFQIIVDPIQLKIITRFFAQLKQFQKILKSVMNQLNLGPQIPLNMSRKDSKGKSGNFDLFSSIMMSIAEPASKPAPSAEIGIYNNMMQSPQMLKSAAQFNQNAAIQLRKSGQFQEEGWKNINFKQQLQMLFRLSLLEANFLKYVTAASYQRKWSANQNYGKVNESLGCSHYRLLFRSLQYNFKSASNLHDIKIKVVKLQDARLKNSQSVHLSVSQQFYDLDSSTFYNSSNTNQDYFIKQPELHSFRLTKDQHYCLEELFRLSEGQQPQIINDRIKTYAFMPPGAQCGEGAGLSVAFNGDSKALKVDIKDVAVMVNFQIWKDILNILFPVFLYRKLYQRINLQSPDLAVVQNGYPKNAQFFESQYRFSGSIFEQAQIAQKKVEAKIKVGLVYCFYRETNSLKSKQNLLLQVQKKILDSDNFSKNCFCGINQKGIYAQIHALQWQQISDQFNLSIGEVRAGLLSVVDSKIEQDVKPLLIGEFIRIEESKSELKKEVKQVEQIIKNRTFIPKIRFSVELPTLISFIDLTKKVVAVTDSLLIFKKQLSAKLLLIQQEMANRSKNPKQKPKKQRVIELFVGEVELRMLLISTCLRGLFFRKRGEQKQLKMQSFAVGFAKKMDIRLGQFRNQLITEVYPLTEKYSGIKDTNLILQIGRQAKVKQWGGTLAQQKNKRKLQRKLQFFESFEKEKMNIWVLVEEKIEVGEKKDPRAFRFDKARKNSVIQQEKRIKIINILQMKIYLHVGNLAFLMQHKKEIEDIFAEVSKVLHEIRQQSKDIMLERKQSESEGQPTTQISINLKNLIEINLDIKPDFHYNPVTNMRVLSNTRMFVNIQIPKLKVSLNPDSSQLNAQVSLSLSSHFLHYLDKNIEINPLLLEFSELEGLGFRKIMEMNELAFKIQGNMKMNKNEIQCSIDSIKFEVCLSTIPILQLFLNHFVEHSIGGNYGVEQDMNFIILDKDDKDQQDNLPEDLTQKLEAYELLLQEKKRNFNQFNNRPFAIKESERSHLYLKNFKIGSVKVKLYGGKQFSFTQYNSLYESKATSRSRNQKIDLYSFISLTVENTRMRADRNQISLQTLVQIQRLQLQLSFKRREGLIWGSEKEYTTHLLKINSPLKIFAQISSKYTKIKLSALQLTTNFTDQIFSLAQQFSKAAVQCEKSNWKRQYVKKNIKQNAGKDKMLLIILPEGKITASVQYKRAKLLNERILKLQDLIIHEQVSNADRISKLFNDWALTIFTNNLGTLVSGALFEVLSTCIGLLFGAIKQILMLFFPKIRE